MTKATTTSTASTRAPAKRGAGRPRRAAKAAPKPAPAPAGRRIGYARVSTHEQTRSLQVDALEAAQCDMILEEVASGVKERPILEDALEALEEGDALVVWRLDRLARSLHDLMAIIARLDAKKAHFVSLTESLDTTTPGGRLVYHVTGAIAEFERSLLVARTHAGLASAKARGRHGGRPMKLGPEQVAHARATLHSGAATPLTIAQGFGVSLSTLYRALGREEGEKNNRRE